MTARKAPLCALRPRPHTQEFSTALGQKATSQACRADVSSIPKSRRQRPTQLRLPWARNGLMRCNRFGGHRNSLLVVQLIEQRLGLLQARRIKSFGEPAVGRSEKITGLAALALFAPEACQP